MEFSSSHIWYSKCGIIFTNLPNFHFSSLSLSASFPFVASSSFQTAGLSPEFILLFRCCGKITWRNPLLSKYFCFCSTSSFSIHIFMYVYTHWQYVSFHSASALILSKSFHIQKQLSYFKRLYPFFYPTNHKISSLSSLLVICFCYPRPPSIPSVHFKYV